MIHPSADVQTKTIGENSVVWQFTVILKGAVIGSNCNINCHVFIENDVTIGNNVTVKSGNYLWDGLTVRDNVFIGPNVTFINDKTPRSKQYPSAFSKTLIQQNASVGGGAVVLCGVTIGEYAMIGAGSLVTKNVPARALVYGSPATVKGWLNNDGSKMKFENGCYTDSHGNKWKEINQELTAI